MWASEIGSPWHPFHKTTLYPTPFLCHRLSPSVCEQYIKGWRQGRDLKDMSPSKTYRALLEHKTGTHRKEEAEQESWEHLSETSCTYIWRPGMGHWRLGLGQAGEPGQILIKPLRGFTWFTGIAFQRLKTEKQDRKKLPKEQKSSRTGENRILKGPNKWAGGLQTGQNIPWFQKM